MSGGNEREPLETVTAARERGARRAEHTVPCATVVDSPDPAARGRVFALGPGLVLGRTAGAGTDLVIRDPALSRRHTRLWTEDGAIGVEDLGSRNGTFAGAARVTRATLPPPCLVRAGDTLLELGPEVPDERWPPDEEGALIGRAAPMRALRAELDLLAPARIGVLITGETGAGKELVAQRLHERSGRRGRLVAQNAAAIPATLFEATLFGHEKGAFTGAAQRADGCFVAADGGTLFLDEVADLPLELQPKLLRVLETLEVTPVGGTSPRAVDVRVIAATNADLASEVRAGTFRADLYARIAGARVRLPPLRERRADVARLARHFFATLAPERALRWTPGFVEALVTYPWPLNVRELRSTVERLALGPDEVLERHHLEPVLGPVRAAAAPSGAPSREELERLLALHEGNVSRVARALGKHAKQIYRWLEQHGLDASAFR
ncbi:MAG: sigma 54-dependent Fis family transcriptional regulator [Sandaracinaceae bacterium]|nr:sigma 54-dependent Fis family transcriptional regulator [Sandaracinaceae bacterium]